MAVDIKRATIRSLRKALDSREISAKELCSEYFSRIEAVDGKLQSYITVTRDEAMRMADEAQKMIDSGKSSALTGIPIAVKDNICTDGVKTTCSSKMLGEFIPPYDATVIERLKREGFVLLGKISLLDYNSDDYDIFLSNWIYTYSGMGLKEGLGAYIGSDYTPPYLYLLLIISRFKDYPWQYMIKAISMGFEVLMGYAMMKLAGMKMKGAAGPLMVYHIAQLLPTVVFNGAYWGQCDVIYTSFCLLALYLALTKRPVRAMACFGAALSFKLQTVFFLPVLLPLWLRKDVKLSHVLMIPAAYMGMMLPALWGGKSVHHVLTCYLQQAGAYNFITVNAPSLYQLLPQSMPADTLYSMFSPMALCLGFAMLMVICAVVAWRRDALSDDAVLLACLLTLGGVPLFLPKMHERYMFGADVLALIAAVYNPRRLLLPLLFGMASYVCYTEGLPGEPVMSLTYATLMLMAAVALTGYELWRELNRREDAKAMEVKA